MADVAAEYAVGLGVGDVKPADGSHEPIGEHVQRGSLEMGNEKEQEMLMTKTGKEAAIRVHEKAIVCFSDDDEGMSGAHEARACELFAETGIAIAVVAEALLELAKVALRIGKLRGSAGLVADPHADEIGARQNARVFHGEERHVGHAVVLELAVAHEPPSVAVMEHQRRKQIFPMRGHRRSAMLTHERQILFALLIVRPGEGLALGRQPLDQPRAMAAAAILLPIGRIGATEAEQRFLRDAKLDVISRHLERQDRNVDIEEEIEVDMDDLELDPRLPDRASGARSRYRCVA